MDPLSKLRSHTQQHPAPDTSTAQLSITPDIATPPDPICKFLTADRLEALLQTQRTDPFCKMLIQWESTTT